MKNYASSILIKAIACLDSSDLAMLCLYLASPAAKASA